MSIYDLIEGEYAIGIMFQDFRHHKIENGRPTTKLLNLDGKHLTIDADLFYPLRNGLVICQYEAGQMTGYSYLEIVNGEIKGIPKTPYGTLRNVKNEVCLPDNIARKYIPLLIGKGSDTWFYWKMWINDTNLPDRDDGTFNTLTTDQIRVPNVGVIIDYKKNKEAQNGPKQTK